MGRTIICKMLLNWCLILFLPACLSVCHLALDTAGSMAAVRTLDCSTGSQTKLVQMFVTQAGIDTHIRQHTSSKTPHIQSNTIISIVVEGVHLTQAAFKVSFY